MDYNNYQHHPSNGAQNHPDYNNSYDDRELPTLPPSYSPQPGQPKGPQPSSSPFVAPFDDHVYPASRSASRLSNPSLGENTAYYGQGGGGRPQDSANDFRDTIPLRDQATNPDASTDHVYDVGQSDGPTKRKGFSMFKGGNGERTAWVVWLFTTIQIAVFIGELVKAGQLTGSPIQTSPRFNPMIGPSQQVIITMGARYGPCMHNIPELAVVTLWPCPNSTTDAADCSLSEVCGFGGVPDHHAEQNGKSPNQWYRFILPMFLHAGLIHIGFNMLLQATLGRELEKEIGHIRFFLVYICSGIFGFVLGGNFAAPLISSMGASGSLFGIIALTLLDLFYTWSDRKSPWMDLGFIILDIVISFVLGLLPGLDNFSHIGGFLMGLAMGICILHSPPSLRRRTGAYDPPYQSVDGRLDEGTSGAVRFVKAPVGFFKGRKGAWWAWWLVRVASLILVFVVFIVLLNNFYAANRKTCSWCKYLSCLPVNDWCEMGDIVITNVTTKRDTFDALVAMAQLA